jgi:hypothetical protein
MRRVIEQDVTRERGKGLRQLADQVVLDGVIPDRYELPGRLRSVRRVGRH